MSWSLQDAPPGQILKLERGEHAARIVTVEAVAEALGVSVSELLATGTGTRGNPRAGRPCKALGDIAIDGLEHVVEAMEHLSRGRRGT